jgi:hypothetical protein
MTELKKFFYKRYGRRHWKRAMKGQYLDARITGGDDQMVSSIKDNALTQKSSKGKKSKKRVGKRINISNMAVFKSELEYIQAMMYKHSI